jgi:hypothetical protein
MSAGRVAFCLLLLLPLGGTVAEDNYSIIKVHFLPPVYYVGDEVEARVRLSVQDGFLPAEPRELPDPAEVHIRDVRIIPISDEYDIRISFSTYETGVSELPSVTLGDITLKGVEIEAVSILEEGRTKIEEAFGPALLPGTSLLLALLIGALLIVPVLAVFAVIWIRRLIRYLTGELSARKPYKDLNIVLDELANPSSTVNSRDFYIKLTQAFRDYLSRRLEMNIRAHTASELAEDLNERLRGVSPVERISARLSRFDEVKFGSRGVKRSQRKHDIERIRDAAAAIEEWKLEVKQHVDA